MSRSLIIAFLGAAFLVAPAVLPSAFAPPDTTSGLSGSAQAVTNLNSSRSNIYRTKKPKIKKDTRGKSDADKRMGGGGGHSR
jgi:hypothetical protein